MSQQNIEIAKKGYADFQKGDIPSIIAVLDENIEWTTPGDESVDAAGTRRGKAGVQEFFQRVNEIWEFERFEPREYVAQGDTVVAIGHYAVKSRKTGRRTSADWVMVWKIRNGKLVNFKEYTDTLALYRAAAEQAGA
ncbi:MAG TPA: nuclear transport factor 2 family protein [Bryobacteraceae bacterium]|jgi:hypothetical protein